jgi:UDP-N-acetylmuramoyl-L-alanyl-D-glutamate--2,6-diaminopimelate ligase
MSRCRLKDLSPHGRVLSPQGGQVRADGGPELADVTHDSRQAGPGTLFAARPGEHADGHDFAGAAVAAGSPALLVERSLDLPAPQLQVASVADALGPVSAQVHGEPSAGMSLCGITGTNGKTTTAHLVEAVMRAAGFTTGLLGTVGAHIGGEPVPAARTTPEASDLQRLLAGMRDAGATAAAMEVSSHGLALRRVDGTRFAAAVFTNLSAEHLDFHHTLEEYFAAKARLFTETFAQVAVVNTDDPHGEQLARETELEVVSLSARGDAGARVRASDVDSDQAGSRFTATVGGRRLPVATALPGEFNVANCLAALAVADLLGLDLAAAAEAITAVPGVPGRMEPVRAGQPFAVYVDYAHTPDSLERVLTAARRLTSGRLMVVVGCGGDRDPAKRPAMGEIAARLADAAVLTSDNPRTEDPAAILDQMLEGARGVGDGRLTVEPDREAAIGRALETAGGGDAVVIAGKGHEATQEFADRTVDFDDREVARRRVEGLR